MGQAFNAKAAPCQGVGHHALPKVAKCANWATWLNLLLAHPQVPHPVVHPAAHHAALPVVHPVADRPKLDVHRAPQATVQRRVVARAITPKVVVAAREMEGVTAEGAMVVAHATIPAAAAEVAEMVAKTAVLLAPAPNHVVVLAATLRPQRPPTRWRVKAAKNASPKFLPAPVSPRAAILRK
jgi:hypothetical protein